MSADGDPSVAHCPRGLAMRKFQMHRSLGILAAAVLTAWSASAQAGDAGVVRIADRSPTAVVRVSDQPVVRGQSSVDLPGYPVQQTSLSQLCPCGTSAPVCCESGSCHISSDCPTCGEWVECGEWIECGECCENIGFLGRVLKVASHITGDILASIFPSHNCCKCRRGKSKRLRCRSYRARRQDAEIRQAYRADRCKERHQRLCNWVAHSRLGRFMVKNPPIGRYEIVYPVDPWYGDARDAGVYAAEAYGGPVSVPLAPVIRHTFNYGWGVPSSRLTPVSHMAGAPYYGYGPACGPGGQCNPYYASAPRNLPQQAANPAMGVPAPPQTR